MMWHEAGRKLWTLTTAIAVGIGAMTLLGCPEREPDNGVLIEEDNGVDVDIDAPEEDN